MSGSKTYRDETDSVQARVAQLEAELADKQRRVEELEQERSDHDAVFTRLEGVIASRGERRRSRWGLAGALLLAGLGLAAGATLFVRRAPPRAADDPSLPLTPRAAVAPAVAPAAAPAAPIDACSHPGVYFTLAGDDAVAPAQNARDLSGHKYRRDGSRSPWFTVNGGPLYVHAVGNYLPGDVGTTELSILTLTTKGDSGGYALAHGGKSMLEVQGSNGKHIYGRFEADVSRVADTTRTPPFGTPVVRVRGTFCLPAFPANPSDTGP